MQEKGGAFGDGRMLDVLLGSMRLIVNLTHHNEEGVRVVLEVGQRGGACILWTWCMMSLKEGPCGGCVRLLKEGGLETLLECLIRRDRTGVIVQALREAEEEHRSRRQGVEPEGGGSKKSSIGGPRGTEKESFDAKILSLNILTNCSEKDEDVRNRLGKVGITSITWVAKGPDAEVQDLTLGCQASTTTKTTTSSASSSTTTMTVTVIRLLSRFLLILIRPFADQFAIVSLLLDS